MPVTHNEVWRDEAYRQREFDEKIDILEKRVNRARKAVDYAIGQYIWEPDAEKKETFRKYLLNAVDKFGEARAELDETFKRLNLLQIHGWPRHEPA